MNWVSPAPEVFQDLLVVFDTVDTILLGGVSYQFFKDYWPSKTNDEEPIADKINTTPKVVFSRTLDHVEWGTQNNASLAKGDLAETVSRMKQQSGKDMLLFGGADIARSFIAADLIDEYRFVVNPVLLGNGTRLSDGEAKPARLKLSKTKLCEFGVIILNYVPERG